MPDVSNKPPALRTVCISGYAIKSDLVSSDLSSDFKVGLIPAPSSGGDIWYSKSAYWFLKTGVFQRSMHQEVVGSYIRDFYPPTPSIAQALSFSIFVINRAGR